MQQFLASVPVISTRSLDVKGHIYHHNEHVKQMVRDIITAAAARSDGRGNPDGRV